MSLAFLPWGSYAQKKGAVIDPCRHCVLRTTHPSPLSAHRGFLGCGHFSAANDDLSRNGATPIDCRCRRARSSTSRRVHPIGVHGLLNGARTGDAA